MSDDDFVQEETYDKDDLSSGGNKCRKFFWRFLQAIIVIALIALLVLQLIAIGTATNFKIGGGIIMTEQKEIQLLTDVPVVNPVAVPAAPAQ